MNFSIVAIEELQILQICAHGKATNSAHRNICGFGKLQIREIAAVGVLARLQGK